MKLPALVFVSCCFLLAGCGGKPQDAQTPTTQPAAPAKPSKLVIQDKVVGKDKRAVEKGDNVWVVYEGKLANGTVFDSNTAPDKDPYNFAVGAGTVIKGWDQGLIGMHVGGERHLHIPSDLAYGANAQGKIPANADLEFDIKLLGLMKPGEDNVIDTSDDPMSNKMGILSPIKAGTGSREVKDGDRITIHYVGSLLNGKTFLDSAKKGDFTFTVGKGETLSCIDEGVKGMKVGGVRKIIGPPLTAFVGQPGNSIPYNSEVMFQVELKGIK